MTILLTAVVHYSSALSPDQWDRPSHTVGYIVIRSRFGSGDALYHLLTMRLEPSYP